MADAKINIALIVKDDGTATIQGVNRELASLANTGKAASTAMTTAFAGLSALMTGAVVASMYGAVRAAMDLGDSIDEVATKVGVTTDQLQEMRFAASSIGVNAEATDQALKAFSQRIGEAAHGTGKLAEAAKEYGIELYDSKGNIRSNMDLMRDFTYYISRAGDEQEKLRIATKMFGKEGAGLVVLLRDGVTAFDQARASAHSYGAVMDKEAIAKAGKLNDELDRMTMVIKTNLGEAFLNVAPLIVDLAKDFADLTRGLNQFVSAAKEAGSSAYDSFGKWWNQYTPDSFDKFVTKDIQEMGPPETLKPAPKEDIAPPVKHKLTLEELKEKYKELAAEGVRAAMGIKSAWESQAADMYEVRARGTQAEIEKFKELAEEGISSAKGVSSFWEMQVADQERLTSAVGDAMKQHYKTLAEEGILAAEGVTSAWENQAKEMEAVKQRGLDLINEQYKNEREILRRHYQEEFDMAGSYYEALGSMLELWVLDNQEMTQQLAADTFSILEGALQQFSASMADAIVDGKSLGDAMRGVWKALMKEIIAEAIAMTVKWVALSIVRATAAKKESGVVAVANTVEAVSESGKQGSKMGPWGIAAYAAIALAAMAAAIAAAKSVGGAHGGLDFVPDEQTFLLQRGERVLSPRQNRDITEAVQRLNAGAIGGGQTIVVQSVLDGRILSESVAKAAANGYAVYGNTALKVSRA